MGARCAPSASSHPATRYLVNVRTNTVGAANSAGNNGYAIEAVVNGNRVRHTRPEHLRLRQTWACNNQNRCRLAGVHAAAGTFYLAKVGPQYAGKTLVIELYDAGRRRPAPATPTSTR